MGAKPLIHNGARTDEDFDLCESRLQYSFRDRTLLKCALTHSSGTGNRINSNERLEFLGDSILGMVICDYLYENHPDFLEGELTKIKSVVVSRQTCALVSLRLGMEQFLLLGRGMRTQTKLPQSLLADVFESIIGAIYLDTTEYSVVKEFILTHLADEIKEATKGELGINYKSQLQQIAQRTVGHTPTYQLISEKGPDHNKFFEIRAKIGDQVFEAAWGPNKKEAEQSAANLALIALDKEISPESDPKPAPVKKKPKKKTPVAKEPSKEKTTKKPSAEKAKPKKKKSAKKTKKSTKAKVTVKKKKSSKSASNKAKTKKKKKKK